MRRTVLLLILSSVLAACLLPRRRPRPEPTIFPVATEWTSPLGEGLDAAAILPPLATDGNRIFVASVDGTVRGVDGGTGSVRWSVAERPGPISAQPGLLVVRDAGGTVWAMGPATGATRWKAETGVAGSVPAAFGDGTVYVGGAGLVALDAATGSVRWTADPAPQVSAPPVAWGKRLLVPQQDGTLRCLDAATGAAVWAFATRGALRSSPVVDEAGSRVMVGAADRRFLALGLEDGKKRWTWKIGAQVQSAPAMMGDRVLFATHEDVLYALKRGAGSVSWLANLPSRPLSAPLVAEGAVLVACYGLRPKESFVVGFEGRTGRRLGDLKTPSELAAPPILLGSGMVVGLRDGQVVRYRFSAPEAPEAVDNPPQALPD